MTWKNCYRKRFTKRESQRRIILKRSVKVILLRELSEITFEKKTQTKLSSVNGFPNYLLRSQIGKKKSNIMKNHNEHGDDEKIPFTKAPFKNILWTKSIKNVVLLWECLTTQILAKRDCRWKSVVDFSMKSLEHLSLFEQQHVEFPFPLMWCICWVHLLMNVPIQVFITHENFQVHYCKTLSFLRARRWLFSQMGKELQVIPTKNHHGHGLEATFQDASFCNLEFLFIF